MDTKHTPGPWNVVVCNPVWGDGLQQPATGREVVIELPSPVWGEATADRYAIQAAPLLVEALDGLLKELGFYNTPAVRLAHEALANARGERSEF